MWTEKWVNREVREHAKHCKHSSSSSISLDLFSLLNSQVHAYNYNYKHRQQTHLHQRPLLFLPIILFIIYVFFLVTINCFNHNWPATKIFKNQTKAYFLFPFFFFFFFKALCFLIEIQKPPTPTGLV